MFFYLRIQPWYLSVKEAHSYLGDLEDFEERKNCYESTTLFLFANYQYIAICLAFSIGKPFKKPFYTNIWFTTSAILIFTFSIYIHLFYNKFFKDFLNIFDKIQREEDETPISVMPKSWFIFILFVATINFISCFIFESIIVRILCFIYYKLKAKI